MKKYLESIGLDLRKQQKVMTPDVFLFGPTRYKTLGKILCPIKFKDNEGNDFWIQTDIHLIDNKIGIILGPTRHYDNDQIKLNSHRLQQQEKGSSRI